MKPTIIGYDIETLPAVVFAFDAKTDYISHDHVIREPAIVCAAWTELGSKRVRSISALDYPGSVYDDKALVKDLRDNLAHADMLIGQNSTRFDTKMLYTRLSTHSLPAMPPIPEFDILTASRKSFKRFSHRLDARGHSLGLGGKDKVSWDTWRDIAMTAYGGDKAAGEKALRKMVRYNKRDVSLMMDVYQREKAYYRGHPSLAIMAGLTGMNCPTCMSPRVIRQGVRATKGGSTYTRYQCTSCGSWSSDKTMLKKAALR